MKPTLVVVDDLKDWKPFYASEGVITVDGYLFGDSARMPSGTRVINVCRDLRYLSLGYYCSLLAEARGHRVLPSVRTINDLARKAIYSLETSELDELLQKPMAQAGVGRDAPWTLDVFFGEATDPRFASLGRQVFETFPAPMLQVELRWRDRWRIASVRTLGLSRLRGEQEDAFARALDRFSSQVWRRPRNRRRFRYDLAILHDPDEKFRPSNARALARFRRVGRSMDIDVDLITPRDYPRLAEYDALFIRQTTAISDHTYRFAKRAEAEGMVVIDDPQSILRCTNKVYLSELLEINRIPRPASRILRRGQPIDAGDLTGALGIPLVLKIPDGSFSRGVVRVDEPGRVQAAAESLFRQSDLILAQEFVTREYDWRIGVLDGRAIFACQYHFAKGHWQTVRHGGDGSVREGGARTMSVVDAPRAVVQLAVRAANLIGDGLYGVDLKQSGNRVVVIEVNDNPNIDAGVEDGWLRDELYYTILASFVRRLERKRGGNNHYW